MKRLITLVFLLLIMGVAIMSFKANKIDNSIPKSKNTTQEEIETTEKIVADTENFYCIWLTYSEIGSLVKGKTEEEYEKSVEAVLNNLKANKINTVFYQCRAFCDSFYDSEIFPVSKYITAQSNVLTYDPFEIFLDKARYFGVSVHCWINPYRISYDKSFENLPRSSPARKLYKEDKSTMLLCESGIFLNPAHPESRKLVLDGIREILGKYQVAGIHFDDYFYPEAEKINDEKLYKQYQKQGGSITQAEWRRENVNVLISSVYSFIKSKDEKLIFSISPSADIEKCKNVFYADVEKWCREEGFVDYLIPQIYYGFENESMPFSDVVKEWENMASGSNAKLICGLAAYKCGKIDEFAGAGKNEWRENVNILSRQYERMLQASVWQGFSLFSYSYCFGDNVTEISKKETKKLLCMVK